MKRVAITAFLLLSVFCQKTEAQNTICCHDLTADQLMVLAVDKAKRNDRLKQSSLIYDENYVRKEFDYRGTLKSTEESTTTLKGEARKLAGFNLEIGGLLDMLRDRHIFSFADPKETILKNGRHAFVIEFRPRDNLRYPTTEDKFINRLEGKIVIDAEDQSLWHVESHIPETSKFTFRVWWTVLFATIEMQNFELNFDQVEFKDLIVEDKIEVTAKFRVLGSTRTREYHYQYGNYRIR